MYNSFCEKVTPYAYMTIYTNDTPSLDFNSFWIKMKFKYLKTQKTVFDCYQFLIDSSLFDGVRGVTPRKPNVGVVADPSKAAGLPKGTEVVAEI